jgi:hypothetical protein
VYGTIAVMAVLAAAARSYQHMLWRLVALTSVTAVVLWLAHVYAHGLGESLQLGRRLTPAEFASVARREYSIALAAVPPVAAIALGASGILPHDTAIGLALAVGVLTLGAQGLRYARLERLSFTGSLVTVALNLAIGLALVAAEVFIAH